MGAWVAWLAGALGTPAVQQDRPAQLRDRAEERLSMADFDDAATILEHLATVFPADPRSDAALAQATRLRVSLGQQAEAMADVDAFWKNYGRAEADEAAWLSVGATVDVDSPAGPLAAAMPSIDRGCSADVREVAHATLAQTLGRAGDADGTRRQYAAVLAIHRSRARTSGSEDSAARDAVAEARFAIAEKQRLDAESIELRPLVVSPQLRGDALRRAVREYLNGEFEPWAERERVAVDRAFAAYLRVFGVAVTYLPPKPAPPCGPGLICLQPGGDPNTSTAALEEAADVLSASWAGEPPSPTWAVASAERIGGLYERFLRALRQAPIEPVPPTAKFGDPGWSLDDAVESQARHAYETCLRVSTRYRVVGAAATSCERGLRRIAPSEAPPIDEIRPALHPEGESWPRHRSPTRPR